MLIVIGSYLSLISLAMALTVGLALTIGCVSLLLSCFALRCWEREETNSLRSRIYLLVSTVVLASFSCFHIVYQVFLSVWPKSPVRPPVFLMLVGAVLDVLFAWRVFAVGMFYMKNENACPYVRVPLEDLNRLKQINMV